MLGSEQISAWGDLRRVQCAGSENISSFGALERAQNVGI